MRNPSNPRLKIDLKEIFGVDIDNDALKQSINQSILDKILRRTSESLDVNEKKFKPYSKQYKKSDDFIAFGKSNEVNLRLTGDMLELMDVIDESKNTTTIGWRDSDEAQKAHGHITGNGRLPKRDFFGLSSVDIQELKFEFGDDVNRDVELTTRQLELLETIRRLQRG